MSDFQQRLQGRFIVLDGPDGCGKSTQVARLAEYLESTGQSVQTTRDPGGTVIGDKIRDILLDNDHHTMSVECELMLYMASRAQLASEIIRPALDRGQYVISDRYISSTIAYQGAGGVPAQAVITAGKLAVGNTWPDLTIVLDIPSEQGLQRAGKRDAHDRMESKALTFHEKVRELFLAQARENPDHFAIVDATGTVEDIHAEIVEVVQQRLPGEDNPA